MQEEINTLENKKTYKIVDLPPNKIPIKGRQVLKKKPINNNYINPSQITNKDNSFRYKARWVIQGFN